MRFATLAGLLLAWATLRPAAAVLAQTQPDPAFQPQEIYQPATVYAVRQLSDGSRVVAGDFRRMPGGISTPGLVKFRPDGTLDLDFANNVVNNRWSLVLVEELPGGKLLVAAGAGTMSIGGQSRTGLARLNADGTLDPTFEVTFASYVYPRGVLVQPDGKVILWGSFNNINGAAARNLARLNPDGSSDATFMASVTPVGFDSSVRSVARQADGKLLMGGAFTTFNGVGRAALARLNPDGTFDPTFDIHAGAGSSVEAVLAQPDGNILLTGQPPLVNGASSSFARVLPSGAPDPSFVGSGSLNSTATFSTDALRLQADGKILVINGDLSYAGQSTGRVIRLNPDGTLDNAFRSPAGLNELYVNSMQPLAGGRVLVGGPAVPFVSATATPTGVAVLNADGTADPTFAPGLHTVGTVSSFVQQADGRIVLGGTFTEVNGTAVSNLARLNADGTLDAAYAANAQALGGLVSKVLLQPDGKVLIAGTFSQAGGSAQPGVARLLPGGLADASFAPPLLPLSTTSGNPPSVSSMALQSTGEVLLAGQFRTAGSPTSFVRVSATGQPDLSFQPAGSVTNLTVQPDGRILVMGSDQTANGTYHLRRLLPNGALDPAFGLTYFPSSQSALITTVEVLADGRLLAGGYFNQMGSVPSPSIARLLPNGAPDATFTSGLPDISSFQGIFINDLVVQPNGRVLYAGNSSGPPTGRLLPAGGVDATYEPFQGPTDGMVYQIGVQPDGKLLLGGQFTEVAGRPAFSFTRLTDQHVLRVGSRQGLTSLEAYPNPVHDQLTLWLDAAARPQALTLTDLTGKIVRAQPLSSAVQQLSVRDLAAGVYLLRVDYVAGPVTRRIVVE